jgi:hypothetical protein
VLPDEFQRLVCVRAQRRNGLPRLSTDLAIGKASYKPKSRGISQEWRKVVDRPGKRIGQQSEVIVLSLYGFGNDTLGIAQPFELVRPDVVQI